MAIYLDVVVLINFMVDILLLLATNRLCGYPPGLWRNMGAAALGGFYAGACLVPGFRFLGNWVWRLVSLAAMGWMAFGLSVSALRRICIFALLSMALGGIALGMGTDNIWSLIAAAVGLLLVCAFGFRQRPGSVAYLPVELRYGQKLLRLTALRDTGNSLVDPVTGRSVLVVDANAAIALTGLTLQQLQKPVEAVSNALLPGLRLISYQAVGQPGGMLLALRIPDVRIGDWKGSSLVAFAPNGLSREGAYQALTGGVA